MKLQIKDLKKFKSISDKISRNSTLPILSYLKFDKGKITKSNLESFVVMESDFEGSFLIDEKILMSFISNINAEEIDISVKDKSVVISYGKEKITSSTEDVKSYPEIMDADAEEIDFSSEILNEIKTAFMFTGEHSGLPFTECIFMGNGIVSASTGFVAYTKSIDSKFPEIILEKNAISTITKFNNVSFSQNETYQFFKNGSFKFGFVKKDTKFVNMKPFSIIPEGIDGIEINKKEITTFCDTCINISDGRFVTAKIQDDMILMSNASYEIEYEKPISISLPNFMFNPVLLGKLLKSLPDEIVTLSHYKDKFFITGESGYVSLIMEMKIT